MQNRFKFRVWLEFENKMITPENESFFALNQHGSLLKINDKNEVCWARIRYTFADEDVMQCTGLKDKNGKLIYEGDILKTKEHNLCKEGELFKVFYQETLCQFLGKSLTTDNCIDLCDLYEDEVIGNIYENPELLEE